MRMTSWSKSKDRSTAAYYLSFTGFSGWHFLLMCDVKVGTRLE